MRSDMPKVIIDCYRVGDKEVKQGRKKDKEKSGILAAILQMHTDHEESGGRFAEEPPPKEKMRPVGRGIERKLQGDRLKPLINYLHSQLGRSWDDVYSDIRRNISMRSVMQMHVVQHIDGLVRKNTYLGDDGKVYENCDYRSSRIPQVSLEEPVYYGAIFYVHPTYKTLCVTPRKSFRKKRSIEKLVIEPLLHYRKIDGEWYVITFELIPPKEGIKDPNCYQGEQYRNIFIFQRLNYEKISDVLHPDGLTNYERQQEYGFSNIRAISKRLLGKREKKTLTSLLKKAMEDQRAVPNLKEQLP